MFDDEAEDSGTYEFNPESGNDSFEQQAASIEQQEKLHQWVIEHPHMLIMEQYMFGTLMGLGAKWDASSKDAFICISNMLKAYIDNVGHDEISDKMIDYLRNPLVKLMCDKELDKQLDTLSEHLATIIMETTSD
jgi:lipopolysaccharide export system protein LptC